MSVTLTLETTTPPGFAAFNQTQVVHFLRQHPEVKGVLSEALPHIRAIFGEVSVTLRVIRDPDSADAEELFAFIQVPAAAGSALEKLDRFDEDWWLKRLADLSLPLHFDVEYV